MSFHLRSDIGYLVALAIASGLILVLGVVLRPKRAAAPVVSEAERAQLQNLALRQSLQRRSAMLADYARGLSADAARALDRPGALPRREPRQGEMLIILAVEEAREPRWITGEFAGRQPTTCYGQTVSALSMDITVPPTFARSAVFTLNEDFVGLVVPCDDGLIVVTAEDYQSTHKLAAERSFMTCCGVRFSRDAAEPAGRAVRELRIGSVLQRAGVEPGDRILTVNGQAVESPETLSALLAAPQLVIDVERAGKTMNLSYAAKPSGAGASLARSAEGTRVIMVEPGAAADRIGLEPGDVILRAGDTRKPAPAIVEKLLGGSTGVPVVVSRGDRQMMLEPAQ
jgi:hypothetical protein